jgi:hypothetical protein
LAIEKILLVGLTSRYSRPHKRTTQIPLYQAPCLKPEKIDAIVKGEKDKLKSKQRKTRTEAIPKLHGFLKPKKSFLLKLKIIQLS